jgi:hypothetical protein
VRADSRAVAPPKPESVTMTGRAGSRVLRRAVNLWVILQFPGILAAARSVGPTSGIVIAEWRLFQPCPQAL